ncbi:MAG: tRNA (guanosine(37)-N1)-methyltransferase TrmD [Myxococcota bacterium]
MLRIDVITVFPGLFDAFLGESMVSIAIRKEVLRVAVHDLREFTTDRHRTVDDSPYGGGPGMVMKAPPLVAAIEAVAGEKGPGRRAKVALLTPQGHRLEQGRLAELAREEQLVLVCGRYEGIDQRAIDEAIDEEISIGDYVLSGGEVPAMALIEGVSRLIPGVLGNPESAQRESFQGAGLEGPQFTRPAIFRGRAVPDVLLSGDHAAVARWRAAQARELTGRRRPDLIPPTPHEEEEES